MKRKNAFILCFIALIIVCQSMGYPFWDTLKSYGVMYTYDKYIVKNSYLSQENILFNIPDGTSTFEKDWYPFMLHHDASSSFSKYTGRNLSVMILYTFGSFDFLKGSSNFYNPNSPYQGAFYGGYALFDHNPENIPFGFSIDGEVNLQEIQIMPLFDQTKLVLPSVGCPKEKIIFESDIITLESNLSYIGIDGWTKIDANIKTNTPTHTYNGQKNLGYLQYGNPHKNFSSDEDYPITTLKGRIYIRYIDELDGTFLLYIIAKNQQVVDECDRSILSKSTIKKL